MELTNAIDGYLEYLRSEECRKPKTVELKKLTFKKFVDFMGNTNIEAITVENVNRFRYHLQNTKTKSTGKYNREFEASSIEVMIMHTRHLFRYLHKKKLVQINPEEILIRKIVWRPRYALNMDEVEKILETQDTSTARGLRNKAILELMISTGLRLSETFSLDKNQIDFKTSQFSIKGKGDKIRTVYINNRTKFWLQKYMESRDDACGALFVNSYYPIRISRESIKRMVSEAGIKANITKNVSPHILRHTFATLLVNNNVNIKYVQDLMGHSDLRNTAIYLHINNADVKREHYRAMNF